MTEVLLMTEVVRPRRLGKMKKNHGIIIVGMPRTGAGRAL